LEDDPDTVQRMLSYLYTQNYEDGEAPDAEDNEGQSAEATFGPCSEGPCVESGMARTGIQAETEPSTKQHDTVFNIDPSAPIHVKRSAQLNNVLTYAIAEKYNVAGLKDISRSKFVSRKWSNWSHELPTVVKTVYESTPSSDRGLRDAVIEVCVEQGRLLLDNEEFGDVVGEIGAIGLDFCRQFVADHERHLQRIQIEVQEHKTRVSELDEQNSELKRAAEKQKEGLEKTVKLIKAYESCRHCSADFVPYFESIDHGLEISITLRCGRCHTRHRI